MLNIRTFQRRSFRVQAVQITEQNMESIAEWCGGVVEYRYYGVDEYQGKKTGGYFITIVEAVISGREKKVHAGVGDWITHRGGETHFKIHRDKKFLEIFQEVFVDLQKYEAVLKLIEDSMGGNSWTFGPNRVPLQAEDVALQILEIVEGVAA